jgi:hypothetical protein
MSKDGYERYNQQNRAYDAYKTSPRDADDDFEPASFNRPERARIRVVETVFVSTGTYQQQYRRPWVTNNNLTNTEEMKSLLARSYYDHRQAKEDGRIAAARNYEFDGTTLNSISADFIRPSARTERKTFANTKGTWEDQTCRFFMTIECERNSGGKTQYMLIGYTDEQGISKNGNIDPQMRLTLNSIFELAPVEYGSRSGRGRTRYELRSVQQVLVDYDYSGPESSETIRMRPQEVAASMSRRKDPELQGSSVLVHDTRSSQNGAPEFSDQHNTNPNDYMTRIISGLVNGRDIAKQTNRTGILAQYNEATNLMREASAKSNPFIKAVSSHTGYNTADFKWRDLLQIDPDAGHDDVCTVQFREMRDIGRMTSDERMMSSLHDSRDSMPLNSKEEQSQVAFQICNVVMSLMSNVAMRKLTFFASNLKRERVCYATNPEGIMKDAEMHDFCPTLARQFERQVILPMSENGSISYDILVNADLFGDIHITMTFDTNEEMIFVLPAYCSSVWTPVISSRLKTLDDLTDSFNTLRDEVFELTDDGGQNYKSRIIMDGGGRATGGVSGRRQTF